MWIDVRHLLEVQDLYTSDATGSGVVRGTSLYVGSGEIVCVVGREGAGKSALLKAVYGLVDADAGRVLFDGHDITNIRPQEALCSLGITFVPQGESLFPRMTVDENLELGMYLANDRVRAREALASVYELFPQLARHARTEVTEVSASERRMLELGRALMWAPRLALVDELSTGLAPDVAASIFDSIHRFNAEDGLTVLMAERDARPGLTICHRGYVLELGRQTFEGTGEELLCSDAVEQSLRR